MDSDRQNIKWVPLMEQIPSRPTFRGTCHEVRPSHAGSWTITLRQTASGTADTCRVRFACFLQTYQFSPSATSIHSSNYRKALRGSLQHAPSAFAAPCICHRSVMHQRGGAIRHAQGQRFLWRNSPARLAPKNAIEPFSIHLSYGRQPAREGS